MFPLHRREALRRRAVRPDRGPRRSLRRHARLRQGGAASAAPRSSATPASTDLQPARRRHLGRHHRAGHRPRRARRQLPAACGRARSAAWSASSCRCSPWSTSTSSPRTCRSCKGRPRSCCTSSTSRARSTCARSAAACCSAPTSAPACRGRRATTPWDFAHELLPNDLDRIAPEPRGRLRAFPGARRGRHQARSSTAPSPSRPTATRWSARSAACRISGWPAASWPASARAAASGLALSHWMVDGDPGRGRLGHGRRALRRLGHARLHQRQGARELLAPLPHPLPERGAAGGAAAAHHAVYDRLAGAARGVRRLLRPRASRCGSRPSASEASEDGHLPPLQRPRARRAPSAARCARASASSRSPTTASSR